MTGNIGTRSDGDGVTARGHDQWSHVPPELRRRFDVEFVSIPNAARVAAGRFVDDEGIVDDERRMSFADLENAMSDAVRAMVARGIEPGDRVGLWAPNCWQWIVAALGIQGAGGVLVPVNTRFKGDEAAFKRYVAREVYRILTAEARRR